MMVAELFPSFMCTRSLVITDTRRLNEATIIIKKMTLDNTTASHDHNKYDESTTHSPDTGNKKEI